MRILFFFLAGLLLTAHAFGLSLDEIRSPSCATKMECASQSVVSLLPDWPADFTRNEEPEGSGIVIGSGYLIATADHVLGPAKSARIRTINGVVLSASIVMRDAFTDIAFLRVEKPLPAFEFATEYGVADKACAIGNSFGLDISLTCGVISAKRVSGVGFNKVEDFVQTDASVNPGMSGGALVDHEGNLVGMLSAIFTRQSDANIGVNFAVSARLLENILADFEDDGLIFHPKPGLIVRPSKPDEGGGLIGAEVIRIEAGSAEEKAGVKPGDIILKANNRRIKRVGAYETAIALLDNDKSLDLIVLRDNESIEIKVIYE